MSDKDIFRQQRPAINQGEFDGGGTDDEAAVDALRGQLGAGVQMTGNVPPHIQQMMQPDHPLAQPQQGQQFQQPQQGQFQQPMSEAQLMHQNARKLMQQRGQQQQQPQEPQFNPNFNPAQMVQQNKFAEYRDPKYEETMRRLIGLSGNYDEIELPSKGKFYLRGEGPSNGLLHIRPMTGHEEQILTTPRFVKKNQALNMIFKECIGEQINPDLLLSEDRTFLLIYLRGISYSPLYDVEVKCPSCDKAFQTQIHLNSLEVDFCPDDYGAVDLEDVLPNSGLGIRYRLSTGRDETLTQEHKDKRVKDWGDQIADDTTLFRASLLVEEINGITNKTMIQQILEKLPIGDMAYIRELLNEPPFGVNTKVGIVCPLCSHDFEVDMPMEVGFFFPKPNLKKKKKQQA
jgi:hypothetical protein